MNSQLTNEGRSSISQATSESACGTSPRNTNVIPFRAPVRRHSPQVIARKAKPVLVPGPFVRDLIWRMRLDTGRSDYEIAQALKRHGITSDQVRLTIYGYELIADRKIESRKSVHWALRTADQEIEAGVWDDIANGDWPPAGPARRAA